jgi:ribosome biogenesis GTPase
MSNKNSTILTRGLVVSYFGNSVAVEAPDGQVIQCHLKRNQPLPVVGDYIMWERESSEMGSVAEIEPRRSLLSRGDARGRLKPLAANIDYILVVMSPPPIFQEHLVDRYLVAAELLDIEPVLVMNKEDLLNNTSEETAKARLEPYVAMGYKVVLTTALHDEGVAPLITLLKDKSAVLVGPSGVGKSSIIAKLCQISKIQIGEVSNKGIGKHTTTATRLYQLPDGGSLIDSPGVRDFNLWPITLAELQRGFRDIREYFGKCRFRNCSHLVEPDCAIQSALEGGQITAARFASYQELMKLCK